MLENPVSLRTKKQNILNQKVKPFRRQLSQSLNRVTQKSSMHTLARTVYSQKNNQDFSPIKQRPPSASSHTPTDNPQMSRQSSALKGLNMRASHIPNLSEINTELLQERRRLQERIALLNSQIAKETRMRNKAETNWKLHANQNAETNHAYQELTKKSAKLNDTIGQVRAENGHLSRQVGQLRHLNGEKRNNISQEEEGVRRMGALVNNLKNNLMQEERQRNSIKAELLKEQRIMDSLSIQAKELQNQRAMVLLDINHSVLRNKI